MEIVTKSHIDERHAQGQHFPTAETADGLFSWHHSSPGYVGISCALSGLTDNTAGKVGRHVVYLQHGAQDAEVSPELLAEARAFSAAVAALRESRHAEAERAAVAALLAEPVPPTFPYRSSEEAWDAEDEATWAEMRRHGL